MKSDRHILRKHVAVWMFAISAVLFLPGTLFAKGDVIGYLWGSNNLTNEQLENLTHVMAVDLYFDANGNLIPNPDPSINNFQSWLNDLVVRAQQRIVIL